MFLFMSGVDFLELQTAKDFCFREIKSLIIKISLCEISQWQQRVFLSNSC